MSDHSRRDSPLNAPFADLGRALKKVRRKRARAKAAAVDQPPEARPAPEPAPGPSPGAPALFTDAICGAEPIDHRLDRVRPVPTVDPARLVAAGREEVVDLDKALGFDLTYSEHFCRGRAAGVSRETLSDLERGRFAVKAHIDLHGWIVEEALREVDTFLRERQRRGDRCLLIVTGKGNNSPSKRGILREKVPQWLARGPSSRRVLAFATARECDGGVGALYVLLRSTSSRKNHIDLEFGGVGGIDV